MSNANTPSGKPPLALIAGPTASGKSDLAVRLALTLEKQGKRAVVINADSAQVYADLRVLSARPSEDDMQGVPHRLFGEWDGAVACSAADWAARAKAEIEGTHASGAIPILVGGTGLYIRTLLDGIAPVPEIDPEVRRDVRALTTAEAYVQLVRLDPERSASLSPNDATRIRRALEVARSTGRTLAEWQLHISGGIGELVELHPLVLLPEREPLYSRCDARFTDMLNFGAIEEVRALLARKLDPALPVMRAIGVSEITALLGSEIAMAEAEKRGQQATRNYAKRQYTWLRNQLPTDWPRMERQTQSDVIANYDEVIEYYFDILFHK